MEFMVHMKVNFPENGDTELFSKLVEAENLHAKQLASEGIIKKLWRRPGQKSNVGIWSALDATQLHSAIASLPLFQWLEVEVWPLAEHPNDPKKNGEPI